MQTIEQAGIEYLKKNISVIPVSREKKPLIQWAEFQKRRATETEFRQWLRDFPDMQIAAVTGKISGLLVVDIDQVDMDISWLPETATIRSGSGGTHLYYAYTPGFSNKARIKENIDIRGDGGYIILPPSFNLKGQYKTIKAMNCAPFPVHLFTKSEQGAVNYQTIKTEYTGYGQGQRNDEMTRYIGHLLAKIHPSEWETIAWQIAVEANAKNTPPLSEYELKSIFQSISNKEKHNTTERWYKKEEKKKTDKVECNLIVKKDYLSRYTWGTRGLDTGLAIIKRGNFIIIGASRNSGKTSWSFDFACKNALLGHKVLYISLEMEEIKIKEDFARKYSGITIEEEYDYTVPPTKKEAFQRKMDEISSIKNLFFRGVRRGNGVSWDAVVKIINEFTDLDLIFIDNLDLIEGLPGEQDNDRQKRITKKIMGLTTDKQIPVILIHHHRKKSGKDYGSDELAGSGKIGDNADIIIKIERNVDPNAPYPDKYESRLYQQKGRGYPQTMKVIYFIKGSFEDVPPIAMDCEEKTIFDDKSAENLITLGE
jgi:hypothetical protein